jgi:hypothetical protein
LRQLTSRFAALSLQLEDFEVGSECIWPLLLLSPSTPCSILHLTCLRTHARSFVCLLMQLEDMEISGSDYIRPLLLGNFRGAWETLDEGTEREDDYGLGPREHLQVGVVFVCWVVLCCYVCLLGQLAMPRSGRITMGSGHADTYSCVHLQ